MKISVIVATYNRIDALHFVLQSLETQTDTAFEVIIADDGSREDTCLLYTSPSPRDGLLSRMPSSA